MRVIEIPHWGGADVLRGGERPQADPGAGQVRVRVHAFALNPIDYKTRKGLGFVAAQLQDHLPWVPGYDLAGVIEAVGPDASFAPGDRVVGMVNFPLGGGAYADAVVCDEVDLVAVPSHVDLAMIAGLPLAGLTALQALALLGDLRGQSLLVLGGASAVGHLACQWAHQQGAQVAATASQLHHARLRGWGVTDVRDYRDPTPLPAGRFSAVLDLVGGDTGRNALAALAPAGRMVTVPTVTAATLEAAGRECGRQVQGMTVRPDREQLAILVEAVIAGRLQIAIAARYAAADIVRAHQALEAGIPAGKHVVVW